MKRCRLAPLFLALFFSQFAAADQIVLKNGDRISGAIVKADGKTLTLKHEFAGTLTFPMDAVVQISSDQPLHVVTGDGKTVVGPITADADKVEVKSAESGSVSLVKGSIVAVRSSQEQAAWEKMQHPGILQLWSGFVDFGLSFAQGNAEAGSYNLAFNASRATSQDKISLYATSLYARNSTAGVSTVTVNSKRGGGRYDYNLNSRSYVFGFADLESDDFQNLDLRVNPGGGFGWHAYKTERLVLDIFGGGSVNREYFATGLRRTSGDLVFGNDLTYKLSSRTSLTEKTVYFPNMSEIGEFRLAFDSSLSTAINRWLAWQVSVSDRYLSNPLPGKKTNDIIFSTGLRVTVSR